VVIGGRDKRLAAARTASAEAWPGFVVNWPFRNLYATLNVNGCPSQYICGQWSARSYMYTVYSMHGRYIYTVYSILCTVHVMELCPTGLL
jgi:hypothetical protein